MNQNSWDELDPAYQAVLEEAIKEATEEIRSQLADIDVNSKKTLEEKGMTVIEYPTTFFDEVLAIDAVKELYQKIDGETNGLGSVLQKELGE